jgi:hypothetical protein
MFKRCSASKKLRAQPPDQPGSFVARAATCLLTSRPQAGVSMRLRICLDHPGVPGLLIAGRLLLGWFAYVNEQEEHGAPLVISDYFVEMGRVAPGALTRRSAAWTPNFSGIDWRNRRNAKTVNMSSEKKVERWHRL